MSIYYLFSFSYAPYSRERVGCPNAPSLFHFFTLFFFSCLERIFFHPIFLGKGKWGRAERELKIPFFCDFAAGKIDGEWVAGFWNFFLLGAVVCACLLCHAMVSYVTYYVCIRTGFPWGVFSI